jgi:hypothetical protein
MGRLLPRSLHTYKVPAADHPIMWAGFGELLEKYGAVIFDLVAAFAEAYSSDLVGIVRRGTVCRASGIWSHSCPFTSVWLYTELDRATGTNALNCQGIGRSWLEQIAPVVAPYASTPFDATYWPYATPRGMPTSHNSS